MVSYLLLEMFKTNILTILSINYVKVFADFKFRYTHITLYTTILIVGIK